MKLIVGLGSKRKVEIFSQICSLLKNLTEFITFEFRPEGLYSQGMSFDQISLYEFMIKKDWFEFYEFNEKDAKEISLNSTILQKIFSTRQEKQFVCMSYDGTPDKIIIQFKNKVPVKTDVPKEFEVTLMDFDNEHLEIPESDYTAEFSITTKMFGSLVEQLEIFDESMNVKCSEENIEFKASGFEGSLSVNLYSDKVDYITEYAIDEEGDLDLTFASKHFQNFCKFNKVAKEVKLSFSDGLPMQMLFILDKTDDETSDNEEESSINDHSYLRFCLAPKISDE